MKRRFATLLVTLLAASCSEAPPKVTLRSMQNSGEATFVCRASDKTGRTADSCPDFETEPPTAPNQLFSLVTQTNTGEVAVIDLNFGEVVDIAPSVPGFTFLRVGARPGDIVTTPGGAASFVGAAEVGKPGIYALPTTCIGPPGTTSDGQPETERDLTTWPACSLPAAPGDLAVLIEPPTASGEVLVSCNGSETQQGDPIAAGRPECAANLTAEGGPPGRRKLAVGLPDLGEIAIIDAQAILDRDPGSFGPCEIEKRVPLAVDLPAAGVVQPLPPDLAGGCPPVPPPTPPAPAVFTPRPSGFALVGGTLYVGDQDAPVIHTLDVSNACTPLELDPLLPASFVNPGRVVTTTRLAVSPVTTSGQQFVYAIDEFDQPAASVMAFDVSPGSTDRTPIVRSGSPRLPFEVPDRIGFGASVRDVAFALRDLPISDPVTGVAPIGTACDPNRDDTGIGTQYRPNSDYSTGARPSLLRGVFGFALLTNGQIVVIDTEDFDAPCRRTISANAASEPDFRGCSGDPATSPTLYTLDDTPATRTVTNEISCGVVQPHRARAGALAISEPEVGIRAPSLRSFPLLTLPESVATRPVEERPRLLAVDFPGATPASNPVPGQVNVGTTLYVATPAGATSENPLNTDPNTADPNLVAQNSLVLPLVQPRSYPSSEQMALSYEGTILPAPRPSGFVHFNEASRPNEISDSSVGFCNQGVYDVVQMRNYGSTELLIPDGPELEQFAVDHADYLQITGDFPPEEDGHWSGVGASCGRGVCDATFGPADASELLPTRELRVLTAFQDRLVVEPRSGGQELVDLVECCFPAATAYTIRVSKQWALTGQFPYFRTDIVAKPASDPMLGFQCVRDDCDPRKQFFNSRAFEISSDCPPPADGMTEEQICRVGPPQLDDFVCVYDQTTQQVGFGGPDRPAVIPQCILQSLTTQFAVYRGRCTEMDCQSSVRGMVFNWETVGGFVDLRMSLTQESTAVLPQSMQFLPSTDLLAVVDGGSSGLALFNLDALGIQPPSPFF